MSWVCDGCGYAANSEHFEECRNCGKARSAEEQEPVVDAPSAVREARLADEAEYAEILRLPDRQRMPLMAELGKRDLYFLLTVILERVDLMSDWFYARCREVEAEPDGCLDLWAREHGKSSIQTYGQTIKDIINDPEVTIGIFSYKKDNAVGQFLRPLKQTFEENRLLHRLYPDVFYEYPEKESPLWSIEHGLTVKRRSTRKEATVSAWGVIQGQPIGSHFDKLVYDDIVTADTVSEGMVGKATEAWSASLNLGTVDGVVRIIGTRWAYNDTYAVIIERGAAKPRIKPATHDGTVHGVPVYMSRPELEKRLRQQGGAVFSAQMLLNPKADSELGFSEQSIRSYRDHRDGHGMNLYMLVDPANSRKQGSSYTAIMLVGLGWDGNYYWLDGVRDRLGLDDRIKAVFAMHQSWQQRIGLERRIVLGYECYGTQAADLEQITREQERRMYRFPVVELRGRENKNDRIARLEPDYIAGRWYWPERLPKTRKNGQYYDLVQEFKNEEFLAFPFGRHPDCLDAMSRIYDPVLGAVWPKEELFAAADRYDDDWDGPGTSAWAA